MFHLVRRTALVKGGCETGGFTFSYEGYSLDFRGIECGCRMIEPEIAGTATVFF